MASTSTTPFFYRHVPKNVLLICLSLIIFPLSAAITFFSLFYSFLYPEEKPSEGRYGGPRKTILVTGVSMSKGLTISRLLSQHTSHRIIGADIEPIPLISPGRWSKSISAFYRLINPSSSNTDPYVDSLVAVLLEERVDLWISCSSVVSAVEDGRVVDIARKSMGPSFQAIQFSPDVVQQLHAKDTFVEYVKSLGLPIPESHRCTSSADVHGILSSAIESKELAGKENKFIMKPIGVNDRARKSTMTLLPLTTPDETESYLRSLELSKENPFQLQQYISGPEYCTHALVIRGIVKAFTACPSSDLLMHYEALPPASPLTKQMLEFTEKVAEDGGGDFTGHLSFDFLAERDDKGTDLKLYAIECNPRAHTAVSLFTRTPEMADAYLDVFPHRKQREGIIFPRAPTHSYYWMGHDLVTFLIMPLLEILCGNIVLRNLGGNARTLSDHLVYWRDGTFDIWDPVPFLVLYHVYWPMQFVLCILREKTWSR
jgi:catechol O-methyltransferase